MESEAVRMTNLTSADCLGRLRAPALAGLVLLTGACETERLNTITDPESAAEALPTSSPLFAASASHRGVPFGFWRLEYSQLGSDYTGLQANGYPKNIRRNLDIARSKGARVFIRFAGSDPSRYQDSRDHFSVTKFKALLDQYKGIDLDSYIADGTLAGHMMIDEPSDEDNWNGDVPFRDLEEAAKHSKSLWPNLPTFVRSVPSWLAGASFRWEYLDGGWAQYSARFGQVDSYRESESRAAAQEGLKVVWGLNLYNGGDGSSKKRGLTSGRYMMSGNEVLKYGKALLAASNSCGFFMWHYDDASYIRSGNVQDALKTLSAEARASSGSCGKAVEDGSGGGGGGGVPDGGSGEDPGTPGGGDSGTPGGGDPDTPTIPNAKPPRALFGSSCSSRTCKFTDRSKRANSDIERWQWSFGDGETSSTRNPYYKYDRRGTYRVVLTVTGADGASNSISHSVRAR